MSWEELLFFGFLGALGLMAVVCEALGCSRWRMEPEKRPPPTPEEEQWERELDVLRLEERHKYC